MKDVRTKKGYLESKELTLKDIKIRRTQKEENIRKLKDLIGKQKGLFKNKDMIRPFKGNVLFYIKEDRSIEIYDGIKEGKFKVEDSEKKDVIYTFSTRDLCRLEWADQIVYCYIQYEKETTAYPRDPWILAKVIETTVDKILTDMSKWKIEEEKVKLGKIWAWVAFAMVIIGGYILYKMLIKPEVTPQTIQTIQNATDIAIQNLTSTGG